MCGFSAWGKEDVNYQYFTSDRTFERIIIILLTFHNPDVRD